LAPLLTRLDWSQVGERSGWARKILGGYEDLMFLAIWKKKQVHIYKYYETQREYREE
jgi:hypothetical protein